MKLSLTTCELQEAFAGNKKLAFKDTAKMQKAVELAVSLAQVKYCTGIFNLSIIDNTVIVENSILRVLSSDLSSHLSGCSKVLLLCVTLGRLLDAEIEKYQYIDLELAYLLDVAGLCLIEKACGSVVEQECKEYAKITERFSLGYGDAPLSLQGDFLRVLNASKLAGVNLTDGGLMSPNKTVTAFVGIYE
jgi:5-methyltetrahydrofolate--homocysteine methyltransferase